MRVGDEVPNWEGSLEGCAAGLVGVSLLQDCCWHLGLWAHLGSPASASSPVVQHRAYGWLNTLSLLPKLPGSSWW